MDVPSKRMCYNPAKVAVRIDGRTTDRSGKWQGDLQRSCERCVPDLSVPSYSLAEPFRLVRQPGAWRRQRHPLGRLTVSVFFPARIPIPRRAPLLPGTWDLR